MNLFYSITFRPASTFCVENFFDKRSSPSTLLIEEKTISAIHLLPASFSFFQSQEIEDIYHFLMPHDKPMRPELLSVYSNKYHAKRFG